jgi:hypothetical protein
MENCDFNVDDEFSKKCRPFYDEYYKTEAFRLVLQKLCLRGRVDIIKTDRDENPLFQKETFLDAIMTLSTGTSIKIDEKAERFRPGDPDYYLDNYCIEVVSNPNAGGKHDGWAYHVGTVIVKLRARVDEKDTPVCMVSRPAVFMISEQFKNEVVRPILKYPSYQNKATGGLFNSRFKVVPISVLECYFP